MAFYAIEINGEIQFFENFDILLGKEGAESVNIVSLKPLARKRQENGKEEPVESFERRKQVLLREYKRLS